VTDRLSGVAVGEQERILFGTGHIEERLGGRAFLVSAESFFQTNTLAAEGLVAAVADYFDAQDARGVLWDVCCGTGTFALCLADRFREVRGIELVEGAVRDAERNAARSGVANVQFVAADARRLAGAQAPDWPPPDAVVLDPPRAGLAPGVLESIATLGPRVLAYVSCNLRSAARDLAVLRDAGYRLERLTLHDLFPHTPHIEGVFGLAKEDGP
jgi:23S rRNA (uracil1939-C5)-methyltransferase